MNKIALVTGATAGIGEACALALAAEGKDLIITGRRKERLVELEKRLRDSGSDVLSLCFDVRDKQAVSEFFGGMEERWKNIGLLVNNAGLAVDLNPVNLYDLDDVDAMVDTNVKGLLYVSKVISSMMIERGIKGQIVNIASIAGKEVYPNGSVYCATKHAVDAITRGMRMEFVQHGIRVSQICPGLTETEFSQVRFKGDLERAANVYAGFEPLVAQDIANALMYMISVPAHVNIADLLILPSAQGSSAVLSKK